MSGQVSTVAGFCKWSKKLNSPDSRERRILDSVYYWELFITTFQTDKNKMTLVFIFFRKTLSCGDFHHHLAHYKILDYMIKNILKF